MGNRSLIEASLVCLLITIYLIVILDQFNIIMF